MMVVVPIAILTLLSTSSTGVVGTLGDLPLWFYALPVLAYAGATSGAKFGIKYISTKNIMTVFMVLLTIILVRYLVDLASVML